ncbi:MAG: extracellular solute-binding protein [Clostridia bacterium]|nr:extracellular solute-binding protein [Clostridia bacterium]
MKTKRTLAWILALLMLASSMAACSAPEEASAEETGAPSAEAETVPEEAETEDVDSRASLSDNLPEGLDYEGYEFRIFTYSPTAYEVEELTGDVVEDSKYARNLDIQERFNAVIKAIATPGIAELDAGLKASVMAGDHAYDIAIPHQIQSGPGFINGDVIRPWNDVPYIDATRPWWNQTINETIRILDQQYNIAGYITMPTPFCMYANKGLLADYGYEDIYGIVKEGTWTLDKLAEITSKAYVDLDGGGTVDTTDQYGISFNNDNTTLNFMYSSGMYSVIIDETTGMPVPNVFNDKMISLIDKMYNLIYEGNQTLFTTYNTQKEQGIGGFHEGRILFLCGGVGDLATHRDADIDLGVIPYPKWDEAQDTYHTHVDAWNGMLCIPKTAQDSDLERTGVIVEAMAAYTYKFVIPDYYDVALGTKYVRDEQSREMLDLIFDGVVYDFGYIFDSWNGCTWTLPNLMTQKKTDLASYWKGIEKKVNKFYEKLYKSVEENANG